MSKIICFLCSMFHPHLIFNVYTLYILCFVVSNVVNDMKNFLTVQGKPFCDINLVLQGEKIPAHKAILASRSSYFEAMFRNFPPKDNCVNVSTATLYLLINKP